MNTRLLAQLCQIGGAVERGLLTKEDVSSALRIGQLAAQGALEAIEVQAAYEEADGQPLAPEAEAGIEAKKQALLGPKVDPLAGGQNPNPIKPSPFPNPLAPK